MLNNLPIKQLELLEARPHFVFDKHVVEIRTPSGVCVLGREEAIEMALAILQACSYEQPFETKKV